MLHWVVVLLAAPSKCLEVVVLVHQLPVQPWKKLAMLLQRNMLHRVVVLQAAPSKCLEVVVLVHQLPVRPWQKLTML